jgi:hypothetical protein
LAGLITQSHSFYGNCYYIQQLEECHDVGNYRGLAILGNDPEDPDLSLGSKDRSVRLKDRIDPDPDPDRTGLSRSVPNTDARYLPKFKSEKRPIINTTLTIFKT